MSKPRLTPEEARDRILDVAEEHFRRVGYAKTAVADIALVLGMSPANIYRFFSSKSAINDAICDRLMCGCRDMVRQIVEGEGTAAQRMETVILAVHRRNRALLTQEKRVHDMVQAAMDENWGAIKAHVETMESFLAELIAEGIAAGEFAPCEPRNTAETVFDCCIGIFHPTLIAQCADQDLEHNAHRIIALILRALRS